MNEYREFHELTPEQAADYCRGSETQPVRKYIADLIGRAAGGQVLDLCCGNGIDAEHYSPGQYVGVDFSAPLIEAAKKRFPKRQEDFSVGDARTCEGFKQFDYVIIKSALEHVASEEDAVAIFTSGLRLARIALYVAWHTPPRFLPESFIQRTVGHFGKQVNQNTYRREPFLDAINNKGWRLRVERVGIFHLWKVTYT